MADLSSTLLLILKSYLIAAIQIIMNEIKQKGIRIFGGLEEFEDWINSKNMALGDVKPKNLMNTHED